MLFYVFQRGKTSVVVSFKPCRGSILIRSTTRRVLSDHSEGFTFRLMSSSMVITKHVVLFNSGGSHPSVSDSK